MRGSWSIILAAALLSGCAAVVEGRHQEISVATTPEGASCTLNREGVVLAKISPTPGSAIIEKNKYDITVQCELDGYKQAAVIDESDTAAALFGNVLVGGLIGVVIDTATGAYNKYDSPMTIALEVNPGPSPGNAAPVPRVVSTPIPAPAAPALSVAPAVGIVDFRRAEMAAVRYRVLHRLAAEGRIPRSDYDLWAQQNAGAFLLVTAPPPLISVSYKAPSYEDLSQFLQAAQDDKNPAVGKAEREALLRALMPAEGPHAQAAKPPADPEALRRWFAFLDQVGAEKLVPPARIEAEKAAINDARLAEGLTEVGLAP